MAIAPWLPLGGLASSLGGLTSPKLILGGLTSLTVTLRGLLGSSLPDCGGLTSFIVTLGGLISLMTDLRGFTSMVIRLGSSTSMATIALHKITPPVLSTSQLTLNIHTITPSSTLDCIRMFVSLHQIRVGASLSKWRPPSRHPATRRPTEFKAGVLGQQRRRGKAFARVARPFEPAT